mmetsp:Transcript_10147/g.14343  ORF Transcript_10147/g.14343 Transcript_10147/m.14343 type:complete len:152 (+) Transcript_10147:105-560(+)|eukprot:CAMPEP_0184858050 /NCGR_PEP_ID=MMETSP0580-20130426/3167_1 /TAXON_ID=1118495 /ORGANISM="Dactyliosolen fragilissimus" /LENGTH=151 /DNA_ID=CAMNT_0027353969 /DNA_START=55 /DNA_END=510 /DNA_ORIENTATION=-
MAATVIESWKLITAIDNYEEIAGDILFRKIFTIAPEAQSLFPFAKNYAHMSEEMFKSKRFKHHAKGVISTVNVAVSMLGPDLEPLVKILKDLGKKHVQYGVLKPHYEIVGQALIETLAAAMGDKFTNDVKNAWISVYDVISSTMIEGAGYS